MFAFILDSLGGTELIFILVIALIFFGPRKLPELAKTMGKGLAEFRKASDDFKRTWEREVEIEASRIADTSYLNEEPSYGPNNDEPLYKPADGESVVSRGSSYDPDTVESSTQIEPTRKQDWL